MGAESPDQPSDSTKSIANNGTRSGHNGIRAFLTKSTHFIRSRALRLNFETFTKYAGLVAALAAVLQLFFGQKYPLQMITAEHLYTIAFPQQRTTASYFSTCVVGNDGSSPAEDINATVHVTLPVVLDDYFVTDVQGLWHTISGGVGADYLTVGLARLHPGQMLTITVTTKTPTEISCLASSKESQAREPFSPPVTALLVMGFVITYGMLVLIAVLVSRTSGYR